MINWLLGITNTKDLVSPWCHIPLSSDLYKPVEAPTKKENRNHGKKLMSTKLIITKLIIITLASKVMQFQPSNLLVSSVHSIILWMHTDDAMKQLKCMSVSFECYKLIAVIAVICVFFSCCPHSKPLKNSKSSWEGNKPMTLK